MPARRRCLRIRLRPWIVLLVLSVPGACASRGPASPPDPFSPAGRASDGAVRAVQSAIDTLLDAPDLKRGTWGILVRSIARGETIYARNARTLLVPGSALKIATLAAAADRLGWEHTYQTRILAIGAVDFGFLDGDLLVVGSGDPSIDERGGFAAGLFQIWAERLMHLGIRTVGGGIIGDDSVLEDDLPGRGWAWDDLDKGYAAGAAALQYNESAVLLTITPGSDAGEPASAAVTPPWSGLVLRSEVTTGPAEAPTQVMTRRLGGSALLEVRGTVPAGGAAVVRRASVPNPTLFFVRALREALIANGVEVRGAAVDIDDLRDPPSRDDAVPFVVHRSPPLSTLAIRLMKNSQNLYAETLLKTIDALPEAAAGGPAAVQAVVEGWGIGPGDLLPADGSGLSRENLVTAEALVNLLSYIECDERLRAPFIAALPEAGRDGTLALRMKGTPAEGNARAKTGSMSNVRALAGFVRTADGELLAFAIVANNFGPVAELVERTTDAIVVRLATLSRR